MLDERLDGLVRYFNRGLLDVPDELLDRNARFSLNGIPYETYLGRSTDDPLVRLIARGPAGYRFVAQAVLRAVPGARATLTFDRATGVGTLSLAGTLRGSTDAIDASVPITLTFGPRDSIVEANLTVEDALLAHLRDARARP